MTLTRRRHAPRCSPRGQELLKPEYLCSSCGRRKFGVLLQVVARWEDVACQDCQPDLWDAQCRAIAATPETRERLRVGLIELFADVQGARSAPQQPQLLGRTFGRWGMRDGLQRVNGACPKCKRSGTLVAESPCEVVTADGKRWVQVRRCHGRRRHPQDTTLYCTWNATSEVLVCPLCRDVVEPWWPCKRCDPVGWERKQAGGYGRPATTAQEALLFVRRRLLVSEVQA